MFDTLIEEIFRVACFPISWPLVRLVTLGKYPCTPEADWTAAVGLAISSGRNDGSHETVRSFLARPRHRQEA